MKIFMTMIMDGDYDDNNNVGLTKEKSGVSLTVYSLQIMAMMILF